VGSRGILEANEHDTIIELAKRAQSKVDHSRGFNLRPYQLETLVKLKIGLRNGGVSLAELNALEAQFNPQKLDEKLQNETPENSLRRFENLLRYLNVTEAYENKGPALERNLLKKYSEEAERTNIQIKKIDRELARSASKLDFGMSEQVILWKKLINEKPDLTLENRKLLRKLASSVRQKKMTDDLIASRMAIFLLKASDLNLPIASVMAADFRFSETTRPVSETAARNLSLPRLNIEVVISTNYKIFRRVIKQFTPRQQTTLQEFKDKFKTQMKDSTQKQILVDAYYSKRELNVALKILREALEETNDSKRTFIDFVRWTLDERVAPVLGVEYIQTLYKHHNTFFRRLRNWIE
jgi:hypothetical protein